MAALVPNPLGALLSVCAPVSAWLSALWVTNLWQGVVVVACAAVLDRAMPRLTAELRHRLWVVACGVCALLPLADCVFAHAHGAEATAAAAGALTAAASGVAGAAHPALAPLVLGGLWSCTLAAVWALGALWSVARLATGLIAVRSLLRHATALEPSFRAPSLRAGTRGMVRILLSDATSAPVATGYLRPAVVLPRALVEALTPDQLDQVLRHELEHLARRDDWTVLLTGCLNCLLPLHPALALVKRKLGETRELACDDAVLRAASPRDYATSLTQIAACAATRNRLRFLPGLLGDRSQLAGRIEHILTADRTAAQPSPILLPLACTTVAALTLALGGLPRFIAFRSPIESPSLAGLAANAPAAPSVPPAGGEPVRLASAQVAIVPAHATTRRAATVARLHSVAATPQLERHSAPASHAILAAARLPFAQPAASPVGTLLAPPATAVFVFWTPQQPQFVTTLVLDFGAAGTSTGNTRQYFTFLEI